MEAEKKYFTTMSDLRKKLFSKKISSLTDAEKLELIDIINKVIQNNPQLKNQFPTPVTVRSLSLFVIDFLKIKPMKKTDADNLFPELKKLLESVKEWKENNPLSEDYMNPYLFMLNDYIQTTDILNNLYDNKIQELLENSITYGRAPDDSIYLPLKTNIGEGLDSKAMLDKMGSFLKNQKHFDLPTYNCSNASIEILVAGAGKQKEIFEQADVGTRLITPQRVHDNSIEYAYRLSHPELSKSDPGYLKGIQDYLLQYTLESINIVTDPTASYFQKARNVVSGVVSGSALLATMFFGSKEHYTPHYNKQIKDNSTNDTSLPPKANDSPTDKKNELPQNKK